MYRINKTGKGLRQDETADMDELKDIYGSKIMNRVKKVHESKDIPGFIDIHCHVLPMVNDGHNQRKWRWICCGLRRTKASGK